MATVKITRRRYIRTRNDAGQICRIHGLSNSSTYRSWAAMMNRCYNDAGDQWHRYGARSITVCEKWQTFSGFLADMGERPIGTSIDRIDTNGNYEPDNCRWADQRTQQRNKTTAVLLTHNGQTKCVNDWSEQTSIPSNAIYLRLRSGWSAEKTLTRPWKRRKSPQSKDQVKV